jgi:cytoskeletal protein CcmA (bactofilin family)
MWKKDEEQSPQSTVDAAARPQPTRAPTSTGGRATIGPSISIRGDVTGSEDLLIQGRVDGSVTLDLYAVSVGGEGRVTANISGRVITIEGTVEGDLTAEEQIILRGTAHVQGDIKAPRVVLEDGATFRGLVDMGAARSAKAADKVGDAKAAVSPTTTKPAAAPTSGRDSGTTGSGTTGAGTAGAGTTGAAKPVAEKAKATMPDRART